ncbi:MAG: glycosyltransferase [Bacteroidales bacterium]|nr:glycosyltransferase [Bacteroidales bacterium]
MRILFICNYKPSVGGISGQVEMLQRHLREEGHIADIYSTKGSKLERVLMPLRLKKIVQEYDVIHIHCCSGWGFLPAILGITACKKIGKRTILTYHGGDAEQFFEKHEHLVKRYLSRTNSNIVLSGYLEKVFNKHGINCTIIPNILEFNKDLFLERDSIKPHYICIRSLRPIYNIPCILDAFQIVKTRIPTATLTLVGDGVSRKNWKNM